MLSERLRQGKPVIGTMIRFIRNPAIVKVAADAGFDFVMIDLEHGPHPLETVSDMVTMAQPLGLAVAVRVPELSRAWVSRSLDCGVDAVMVPVLETPQQARQLVDWAKFTPVGRRGLGTVAGHSGYTQPADAMAFMAQANRRVLTIAQIETKRAIDEVDAIAATAGLDALLVGPNDLANSLGIPGQLDHPRETAAIEATAAVAQKYGKIFGVHSGEAMLRQWAARGLKLILNSLDSIEMIAALQALAQRTREIARQAAGEAVIPAGVRA